MTRATRSSCARGFTMIEILVTLVVTTFGLLGLAGFVARATTMSTDAVQRARAAVLVNDMAARINTNRAIAGDIAVAATGQLYGSAANNCEAMAQGAARQLCEWNNLLAGTNDGGGARFLGYRGCVTRPVAGVPLYVVTVTWGSLTPGSPPTDACGKDAFGDESLRRVLRLQVRVATLAA